VSLIATVAIIGAGKLGRRLAFLSAQAGYRTILEDVLPSNLRSAAADVQNFATAAAVEQAAPVEFASNLETAVRNADLIIDCVPDELESKLEIFSLLDRMAPPRSILATPTLNLSIADLASCTYRAEQCVALQLKPLFLGEVALPEVIPIFHTAQAREDVLEAVASFWRTLGHSVSFRLDTGEEISSIPVEADR
jgi:3-hydroxybutyryl-CoA dehydrogenase